MKSLLLTLTCLFSINLSYAFTVESASTMSPTFEVTQVEDMEYYTEGARLALGLEEKDLLMFNEGDEMALILSCKSKTLTIIRSRYENLKDQEISIGRKSKCLNLREAILEANASDSNKITFVFNDDKIELIKVILP